MRAFLFAFTALEVLINKVFRDHEQTLLVYRNGKLPSALELHVGQIERFIAGCSIAWRTVIAFLLFGKLWLGELGSMPKSAAFFLWLFAVILWCAFGVVDEADHLAGI